MEIPLIPISERMGKSLRAGDPHNPKKGRKETLFFAVRQKKGPPESEFLPNSCWRKSETSQLLPEDLTTGLNKRNRFMRRTSQESTYRGAGSRRESCLSLPRVGRGSIVVPRSQAGQSPSFRGRQDTKTGLLSQLPPPIVFLYDFLQNNLINYPQNASKVFYFVRKNNPYSYEHDPSFNAFE